VVGVFAVGRSGWNYATCSAVGTVSSADPFTNFDAHVARLEQMENEQFTNEHLVQQMTGAWAGY
jgi:hypothetical protein